MADSNVVVPDTEGDVGPKQFIVMLNGRVRSYDKRTGRPDGGIDLSTDTFWAPAMTPVGGTITSNFAGDPHIRYDRLTKRWIAVAIDTPNNDTTQRNRIMIASSDGPIIRRSTTWTFHRIPSDAGEFADYPTLGVDSSALYIGTNQISNATGTFLNSNAYVIRKSSILDAGAIVFTPFTHLISASNVGPATPQGVDNEYAVGQPGYFIGTDLGTSSRLDLLRVTDPGGTPTLSAPIPVDVPITDRPVTVPHLGNTGGASGRLSAVDDRLFAANMSADGHIWTAHNLEVDSSGVAVSGGGRDGSRWYEIDPDAGANPTLVQSGTVFDPASTDPRSFWIPSVAVSGQGIMAIGGTTAGADAHADAWFAARLPTDPAGTVSAPTTYTDSSFAYDPAFDSGGLFGRRWGDYSITRVDPNDDQTLWTIQEYTEATDSWGVRIARLSAPPPATPITVSPDTIRRGRSSVPVTITGRSTGDAAFFDPGPDPGGPGFTHHIGAAIGGGVTVNDVRVVDATHVTLNLDTRGATPGERSVSITNPDGQRARGRDLLLVRGPVDAQITKAKVRKRRRKAKFRLDAVGGTPPYEFKCSLDGSRFRRCASPTVLRHLRPGRHVFKVKAIDSRGKVDRTPARFRFRVKR